jgi:hypothetical protein
MTTALMLVALVIGISGDTITIDKGLIDGLRVGDRGRVCYSLTVNDQKKYIEKADCEVVEVTDEQAVVRLLEPLDVRVGYAARFSPPVERVAPAALLLIAQERLRDHQIEAALAYLSRVRSKNPGDPIVEKLIAETEQAVEESRHPVAFPKPAAPAEKQPPQEERREATMLLLSGGPARFGMPFGQARFYNQSPAFVSALPAFWIDRRVSGLAGVSWAEAEGYCRERGKRLPTEFELERGSREQGFIPDGNAEWTSSWYAPYPGNHMPEAEYGEKYRVIRGPGDFRVRTFLLPEERAGDTSFRCACDAGQEQLHQVIVEN